MRIDVRPNKKINIEVKYGRIASATITDCSADIKIVTCDSCGGKTKVYAGKNAICDYCGGKLNI